MKRSFCGAFSCGNNCSDHTAHVPKLCPPSKLCKDDSCELCFAKSFAGYEDADKVKAWCLKDNGARPRDVFRQSNKKFWFLCPVCDHKFDSALCAVVGRSSWCSYCSNSKLCAIDSCEKCHSKSFASVTDTQILEAWDLDKNGIKARDVFMKCNKKFWFLCNNCKHSFDCSPLNITSGKWCPYCGNNKLCSIDDCELCLPKSFASSSNQRALDAWDLETNGLRPRDVFMQSNKKFFFKCPDCCHMFSATLQNIFQDSFCSYCANHKLCNDESCEVCLLKSFAGYSDKLKIGAWDLERNIIRPREVFKFSNTKYWFMCSVCEHSFKLGLDKISKMGRWCKFCAHQELCDNEDCDFCFSNSFASTRDQNKLNAWNSDKNKVSPRDVFKSSAAKHWFTCAECSHVFCSALDQVTRGKWCPKCSMSHGEKTITAVLDELLASRHVEWWKSEQTLGIFNSMPSHWPSKLQSSVKRARWDFVVKLKEAPLFLIEYDGVQHFEFTQFFTPTRPKMVQRRIADIRKNAVVLLASDIFLLRIADVDLSKIRDIISSAISGVSEQISFSSASRYAQQIHWSGCTPSMAASRIQHVWRKRPRSISCV